MSKVKGTLSINESIQKLNNKFNGVSILDEKKKGGRIYWMDKLGYSTMFVDPENPKEWMDNMMEGVPQEQKAHVLTMVFGYANWLVSTTADLLAEKDLEVMIRNDYIGEKNDFSDFMEFRNSALNE